MTRRTPVKTPRTFEEAVPQLKRGGSLSRRGWPQGDRVVWGETQDTELSLVKLHLDDFWEFWVPSREDVMANDWLIVVDPRTRQPYVSYNLVMIPELHVDYDPDDDPGPGGGEAIGFGDAGRINKVFN